MKYVNTTLDESPSQKRGDRLKGTAVQNIYQDFKLQFKQAEETFA